MVTHWNHGYQVEPHTTHTHTHIYINCVNEDEINFINSHTSQIQWANFNLEDFKKKSLEKLSIFIIFNNSSYLIRHIIIYKYYIYFFKIKSFTRCDYAHGYISTN